MTPLKRLTLVAVLLTGLLSVAASQAASLLNTRVGAPATAGSLIGNGSQTTVAMAANDAGWDVRFTADSTLDVLAVTVNWTSVSVPGTVDIRIETDDGTGKPSGTLYDANAVLTLQVPGAGVKTYTFATPPTTSLTIGSLYHALIITTGVGTTQTLGSHITNVYPSSSPTAILTTATATTRNTFTIVGTSIPAIVLTRTGPTYTSFEIMAQPFIATSTNNVFGTTAAAGLIVTTGTLRVTGYVIDVIFVTGTPAADLRIRLFDGSNAVVSGTTVTVDKDVIVNSRSIRVPIGVGVNVVAGTYRVVLDCASCANSSNCYNLKAATSLSANALPNATLETTADVTATPPTWTATSTSMVPVALIIDQVTLPASSGGIIGG